MGVLVLHDHVPSQCEGGVRYLCGGIPAALGICPYPLGTYLITVGASPGFHCLGAHPARRRRSPAAPGTGPTTLGGGDPQNHPAAAWHAGAALPCVLGHNSRLTRKRGARWAHPFAARGLEPKFALRLPFRALSGQLAPLRRNLIPGGT